ncbi:hypothetical protein KCG44_11785 [Pacificimonas sp. WHA3]|uniref:Uncharacterized protein n=1 Tax=Pacificimonas pallii TaxID=2827236 RepID=A0ABS6SGB8_9SPHN|nr:hypothetical protein [Pacificimonas pallii]MBV7257467.1 hypothetical protein [Pacificimonas pallii]
MAKPPKTPPNDTNPPPAPKSDELKDEEAKPTETLAERLEQQKGLPPDAKTNWT